MFTVLGVYKLVYMAELIVAFFLYARKLKRRNRFGLRVACACAANMLAAFFFPLPVYNSLYTSFMFIALFAIMLASAVLCFDEKFIHIVYCGLAAYTTRHTAFQVYSFAKSGFDTVFDKFENDTVSALYGNETVGEFAARAGFVWVLLYMAIYGLSYLLIFRFFGTRIWRNTDLAIKNSSLLILSGAVMLINVILHSVLVYATETLPLYTVLLYVYNILCCVFIFYMMSTAVDMKNLNNELVTVNHLLQLEKEQYERQSQNIELINMRCHDIKHQIRSGLDGEAEKYFDGIEELVNIYDSQVKTGNRELDIILTQKSLFCAKNDIVFTCMADGEKLAFMEKSDVFSLFGNIIDNATESAIKLEDKARRVIDFSVKSTGNILIVGSSNYYDGEIKFGRDGLPLTTKSDKAFHGYGMKSVLAIVNKYGGDLDIAAHDGIFSVSIIMEIKK